VESGARTGDGETDGPTFALLRGLNALSRAIEHPLYHNDSAREVRASGGVGGLPCWFRRRLWLRGYGYMATWLHGYMATWLHGYMATWLLGYLATWREREGKGKGRKTATGSNYAEPLVAS